MKKFIFLYLISSISFLYSSEENPSHYQSLDENSNNNKEFMDGNYKIQIDYKYMDINVKYLDPDNLEEKTILNTNNREYLVEYATNTTHIAIHIKVVSWISIKKIDHWKVIFIDKNKNDVVEAKYTKPIKLVNHDEKIEVKYI